MKKFYSILILLSLVLFLGFITQQYERICVGYKNDLPVFYEPNTRKLYLLKEDKFELLQETPSDSPLRFVTLVKDDYIVYKDRKKMIVSHKNKETAYDIIPALFDLDDEGTLYFTKDNDSIYLAKNGNIKALGIQGLVESIEGNNLYYKIRTRNNKTGKAEVDLMLYDLKKKKPLKKIASHISGTTVIYPDRKYMYTNILHKGTYWPVIYDTDTQKFQILDLDRKFLYFAPYFSAKDNCLIFYRPSTLEMLKVPTPLDFPFTVEDY